MAQVVGGSNPLAYPIPSSRNSPPYLCIYFYSKPPFSLTIRKESSFMHFGKKLGFVHDIETHDPDFDREFLCSSPNKSAVLSLLSRPEVKQAVKDIFSKRFIILKANKNFFVSKRNYKIETDVTIENIKFILERIFIIARGY